MPSEAVSDRCENEKPPERKKRRWFQFSLRTLFLVSIGFAVLFAVVGIKMHHVRQRRALVRAIERDGGTVRYRHEFDDRGNLLQVPYTVTESGETIFLYPPPGPKWLRAVLGEDAFYVPNQVWMERVSMPQLEELCRYSSLEAFGCEDPQFDDRHTALLSQLPNLKALNIPHTGITDRSLAAIGRIPTLTYLVLHDTAVTDAGIRELSGLVQLDFLSLDNTRITDESAPVIAKMTRLETLTVNGTGFTDAGLESWTSLTHLESLDLTDTAITDKGLLHLQGMKRLEWLHLNGTKITDEGFLASRSLRKLDIIEVENTAVTAAAVRQFRQSRPKVSIHADKDSW